MKMTMTSTAPAASTAGTVPAAADAALAQRVWETHYALACSENHRLAGYGLPVYDNSQRLLLAVIREVYGLSHLKARRVYDVLIDSGENVADSVAYVRENRTSRAYTR